MPCSASSAAGPTPRELQQLRRVERAAAQDHLAARPRDMFLAAAPIPHARGAAAVEHDAGREGMRHQRDAAARHRRMQVGARRTPAAAAMHRHVHAAEAFLLLPVDVLGRGIAGLARRLQPRRVQRVAHRAVLRVQRPVGAAPGIAAFRPRLGAAEIRQHVAIGPALGALAFPPVEVERVAAHVDHAVDRGGAADDLAARRVDAAAAECRFRLGLVRPVVFRHVHRNGQRARHLDQHGTVAAAELEQADRAVVLAQPVGQHASRGARADDDVVEFLIVHAIPE